MMNSTEQIWKDYHAKLHSFIQSRVGDASIADDILQEVFLRIHSHLDTLRDNTKIQSWIYQITRNAMTDYFRAQQTTEELPDQLPAPVLDDTESTRQELADCLLPMIENLPEKYRQSVMQSEIEGLTQKALAEKQGISLSGAKSRVQRGRKLIKQMFLDCCLLQFDHRGKVIDYEAKDADCCGKC
ncbi:MAG: RNA polymerase sigma factor SigZ [Candidatus Poribacteria bacterium]|nr:RNA polymerase sigma factor SigZ [Candidatus Poribacteria bacterium]